MTRPNRPPRPDGSPGSGRTPASSGWRSPGRASTGTAGRSPGRPGPTWGDGRPRPGVKPRGPRVCAVWSHDRTADPPRAARLSDDGQLTRNRTSQIATQWHSAASETQAWKYSWYPNVVGQVFGRRVA